MLLAGCSPQGTSQPPGPQAEGRLAALVLWGPTTLAGRVPAESAGRCPQLLENKSVSPSGRLKVTQPFAGDRPVSQVLPPPGVCVCELAIFLLMMEKAHLQSVKIRV